MLDNQNGTCPLGGDFYICPTSSAFVGCCKSDPCSNSLGCPSQDLVSSGVAKNDTHFAPTDINCSNGLYWSCSAQNPTFQGCCTSNPCGGDGARGGCPNGALFPMALLRPQDFASSSASPTSSTIAAIISASTTIAETAHQPTISMPRPTKTVSPTSTITKRDVGIICGAIGGIILLVVLGLLIFMNCRRKKRDNDSELVTEYGEEMATKVERTRSSRFELSASPAEGLKRHSLTESVRYNGMTGCVNKHNYEPVSLTPNTPDLAGAPTIQRSDHSDTITAASVSPNTSPYVSSISTSSSLTAIPQQPSQSSLVSSSSSPPPFYTNSSSSHLDTSKLITIHELPDTSEISKINGRQSRIGNREGVSESESPDSPVVGRIEIGGRRWRGGDSGGLVIVDEHEHEMEME